MAKVEREKFSSQASPEVLLEMRRIAEDQGRQFQSVLDDAMRDYVDRQRTDRPRRHILSALSESIAEYDRLYQELAK